MSLKSILLPILLLLAIAVNSQPTKPYFNYTGNDFRPKINAFVTKQNTLSHYMANYFGSNFFHLYDSLCNQGAGLVKFRINKSGKLTDVACSSTFPKLLREALTTAIMASERYWVVSSMESESEWIVLPVVYDYIQTVTKSSTIPLTSLAACLCLRTSQ
jgi:hypothetical protein